LASLALDEYPEVFQNEESLNLIKEAYKAKAYLIENTDLNSACKKFIKAWDSRNVLKSAELENLELTDFTQRIK
jgi:hypothetical protein